MKYLQAQTKAQLRSCVATGGMKPKSADYKDQLEGINSSYFACVICLLCFPSNDEVIAEEHLLHFKDCFISKLLLLKPLACPVDSCM